MAYYEKLFFEKEININGLRYPKIIQYNNKLLLFGSKKFNQLNDIAKYLIYLYELDTNFNILSENLLDLSHIINNYKQDINISYWIRNIETNNNNNLEILLEEKININNTVFNHNYYNLITSNLLTYIIDNTILNTNNFIFYINNDVILSSEIIRTEEFWGKYLFNFLINNKYITPNFDKYVSYDTDYGQLIHNVTKKFNYYEILFSIRKKKDNYINYSNNMSYIYECYVAKTNNFIDFYDTTRIDLNNYICDFFSYPSFFEYNNNLYLVCNQDDFGKDKKLIIFCNKYNNIISKLYNIDIKRIDMFSDNNLIYLYQEEYVNKCGNRYNNLINNNVNINTETSITATSCNKLYNLMNILDTNDKIICDIGTGKGFAISIFNKFNFKKIIGIEIDKNIYDICLKNMNILDINNTKTNLYNINALDFNYTNDIDIFYFYNPFSLSIFKQIVSKILLNNRKHKLIFLNIPSEYKEYLIKLEYELLSTFEGEYRNYFIFEYNKKIKFLDLYKNIEPIENEIMQEITKVIKNTSFIDGPQVKDFENNFTKYNNVKHCIGVANGTDALEIAIKSLNLPENSEIITQANTFYSTCSAIINNNCKLVLADIDTETYMIDVNKLENYITEKTKVIIPVHLYGHSADMDKILEIAQKYNLYVIEDCAQSQGCLYKGKKVGSIGDIGCFSFYPGKNLGAFGDAGCIVTNNDNLSNEIRLIKNLGSKIKYNHEIIGRNSRLDTIQACVLNIKLKYLDENNKKRLDNYHLYKKYLSNKIIIQKIEYWCIPVVHLMVIKLENKEIRDRLKDYLLNNNIECGIHYPINIQNQEAFKNIINQNNKFYDYGDKILSLPMYPELTEHEIIYICNSVSTFRYH